MKARKIYRSGGRKDADKVKSRFLFVINGKGKYGNGEPWDDYDRGCAEGLAYFIEQNTYANTPNYIDDTLVFYYNAACYLEFIDWKNEMNSVFDFWQERHKVILEREKAKEKERKKNQKKNSAARKK